MNKSEENLSLQQIKEATKHEQVIDDALSSYVEVGLSLREIQQNKLHSGKFIDYAMDRFGMKSHTIYRYMRAAEIAERLMKANLPRPKNVGQAHRIYDLAKTDPKDQTALWKNVIQSGVPVTLSQIDRIAKQAASNNKTVDDDVSVADGEVNMASVHHLEPISISPLVADPLPCLHRAANELNAVATAIEDRFGDLGTLEEEIERIDSLLNRIRSKLGIVALVA